MKTTHSGYLLNGLAAARVARRHGLPLVYECRAFWEDAAVDHGTTHGTAGSLTPRRLRAIQVGRLGGGASHGG